MAFDKMFNKKSKKTEIPAPTKPAATPPPMMAIGQLLSADSILYFQTGGKKSELIKKLVEVLSRKNPDLPLKTAYQAVMEREKVTSTFMESGIAVPHARLPKLPGIQAALAIITHTDGSGPKEPDSSLVEGTNFVFLFLSPEKDFAGHLQVLSRASWLFQNKPLREKLLTINNPVEALESIRQTEHQTTHGPTT